MLDENKTPAQKLDLREVSPLALAFVGDSVLELLVRQRLVEYHRLAPGRLNAEKIKYVSARAQFREEKLLEPPFTPEELDMFRGGGQPPRPPRAFSPPPLPRNSKFARSVLVSSPIRSGTAIIDYIANFNAFGEIVWNAHPAI